MATHKKLADFLGSQLEDVRGGGEQGQLPGLMSRAPALVLPFSCPCPHW
jgi:hypothetical protein